MDEAVIISACRTPIGRLLGGLAPLPATALGAAVVREAVRRSGLAGDAVDEVIMGNVLSAGLGQAPARQAALAAGLPPAVGALTINKVCGSGLKAVMLAAQAVRLGDARVVVAGGMESMSNAPHLLFGSRHGWKLGDRQAVDSMLHDGLVCAVEHCPMGVLADRLARDEAISREDQDRYALASHRKAVEAARAFDRDIVPMLIPSPGGQGTRTITADEGPRDDTTLESLAALRPVFSADGTVTAGNASMVSDGAAALVVASRRHAEARGLPILGRIIGYATVGVEPRDLFTAPVMAIRRVLEIAHLSPGDIDVIEINEAFAAQMLACLRKMGIQWTPENQRVNVRGGAIALGHPIGASGARVLVTLLHAMEDRGARRGLAALCLGGGNAVAMAVARGN